MEGLSEVFTMQVKLLLEFYKIILKQAQTNLLNAQISLKRCLQIVKFYYG